MTTAAATPTKVEPIDAPYVKGHAAPLVAIAEIHPSPTNPRKNLGDLAELIASVKRHGVLQPVLARPNNKGFELVSGHRRLAASKAAGLKEIPCIVREIDDREVLELQLVENCQRQDIHPLEEADALKQLHEKHKIGIDDLAAKVGKSKAYVYGRMKLCDLVDAIARRAFLSGKMSPSIATVVARLTPADQAKATVVILLDEEWTKRTPDDFAKEFESDREWEDLKPMSFRDAADYIQRNFHLVLKDAPFDTEDATLLPAAGACTTCPKRSGAQPELFPDITRADVCTDSACFQDKKQASFKLIQIRAKEKGQKVLPDEKGASLFKYGNEIRGNAPYVAVSGTCDADSKKRSWKDVLGKEAPQVVLVRKPSGAIVQLFERDAAIEALKAKLPDAGKKAEKLEEKRKNPYGSKTADPAKDAAREAAEEKKRERERLVRDRASDRTAKKVGDLIRGSKDRADKALAWILHEQCQRAHGDTATAKRLGVDVDGDKLEKAISKMSMSERIAAYVELDVSDTWQPAKLAKQFGVDYAKVVKEIEGELAAEAKATEKPATAPSKKPAAKGKPKK